MELGKRIRFLRKQYGLLQKELASKIGVSSLSVIRYEKGEIFPRPRVIKKLIEIFEITEAELFGGVSKEQYDADTSKLTDEKRHAQRIPVVGVVKAGNLQANVLEKAPSQATIIKDEILDHIDLSCVKAISIRGESMLPIARDGDTLVYYDCDNEICRRNHRHCTVNNGDLVYVKLKNNGAFFKRYIDIVNNENTSAGTQETLKQYSKKIKQIRPIALHPVNPYGSFKPLIVQEEEIEFIYKVAGILYR